MAHVTPLSYGIRLSEREILAFFNRGKKYRSIREIESHEYALHALAERDGLDLQWLDDWPSPHGALVNNRIWLPHSTVFEECCSFAHELHHHLFAPSAIACTELSDIEIARWEGRASAAASIFVMPLLEYSEEDKVYRAFGPNFRHAAHYRIEHAKKHGW